MKVVINKCFGGFSLSALAVSKLAEKEGKKAYFFDYDFESGKYLPVTREEAISKKSYIFAFSVPNPEANKRAEEISLDTRPEDRTNANLVAVVEELGELANGRFAELKVVEIPDGTDYEIDDYDGMESIHEVHKVWY